MDLRELQSWFQRAVTTAEAATTDADAGRFVEPSRSLGPAERVAIYTRMIRLRFLETLESTYPGLRRLAGRESFRELAYAYLGERPSRHFSLNHLGHDLADWLEECGRPAVEVELARLEWDVVEVFHAAGDEPLGAEALRSIPPDRFAEARFEPVRALRLRAFDHPVNDYLQAVKDERDPPRLDPRPQFVLIHRPDDWVRRRTIDAARFHLLGALLEGRTLGDAFDACARGAGVAADEIAGAVSDWFRDFTAWGLFRAVVT